MSKIILDHFADLPDLYHGETFVGGRIAQELSDVARNALPRIREPWSADEYRRIARDSDAEFFALSGWLKLVTGLDPKVTFNTHPGPLPEFGGAGMYGHHVHEAVMEAYGRGEITHSAVCMHFATSEYDRGPIFFRYNVKIAEDDTPDSIGSRVNKCEHRWQPEITNLVVHRKITWDGHDPESLKYPHGYEPVRNDG